MPNFLFPLLYRAKPLQTHKVKIITSSPLITGGVAGDIIVWDDLKPSTIIYPNLSHSYGQILMFWLVQIPFFNILVPHSPAISQDKVETCLVTLHQDRRVRIFDTRDGRCLSVSRHDCIKDDLLFGEALQRQKCRYLIFCGRQGLYLFDIWKMKSVKHLEGKFRALCSIDQTSLCAIDVDNRLYIINISPLNSEKQTNYFEYCNRLATVGKEFEEYKLSDGLSTQQCDYIPTSQKVVSMRYNFDNQVLAVVLSKQIWLVFDIHSKPWYLNLVQSKNQHRFTEVYFLAGHLLITTRNGSIVGLLMKDIQALLELLKSEEDFVYGFKEFQFTKIAGTQCAKLQINFQCLLIGSGAMKIVNPIHIDEQENVHLFQNNILETYSLKDQMVSLELFIDRKNGQSIQFKGFKKSFDAEALLADIKDFIPKQKVVRSCEFATAYSDDLISNLKVLTTKQFQERYLSEIQLPNMNISSAYISCEDSVYYFGCQNGTIYGFPMIYTNQQAYTISIYPFDDTPVRFIYQKNDLMFASSQRGKFVVFRVHKQIPQQQQHIQLQQLHQQGQEYILYRQIDILKEYLLTGAIIRVIRIYRLENESFLNDDEPQLQRENSQISTQLAIQQENNVIIIINVLNGDFLLKMQGVQENQEIYCLYHDEVGDYWFIVTQDGNALVYDGQGRFIRTLRVEQYHSLFQVEAKLRKSKERLVQYHKISEFKQEFNKVIAQDYHLLEFSHRSNYIKKTSPYPSLYEVGGQLYDWEFDAKNSTKILYLIDHHTSKPCTKSFRFVETIIGEIEWCDLKKCQSPNKLFVTLYPWDVEQGLDGSISEYLRSIRPTFVPQIGIQSSGYALSFTFSGWATSAYYTSMRSMALMHYYLSSIQKDAHLFNNLMVQTVDLLTKRQQALDERFVPMSLPVLAPFTIDESNEVMTAACNLIITTLKKSNNLKEIEKFQGIVRDLLKLQRDPQQPHMFSNIEVICLIVDSYIASLCEKSPVEENRKRLIQGICLKTCLINPHQCAALLKVFVDVIGYFKPALNIPEILKDLFMMFFNYNSVIDYAEAIRETQGATKGQSILREIGKQSDELKLRLKQQILKAIISVANQSMQEFSTIIRKDIVNLEMHVLYPCSIIDIIRHFIKSQQNNIVKHLPFLMEIILKSLDPNNPNLRRVCHRPATSALHTICKTYKCVSFHQVTQRIALGSTDNQIIIYDLRTAVKWRVFDGHDGQVTALEFDHSGKQLASFSVNDWKIKVWKVGSTGFFGSILGIQGRPVKEMSVKRFEQSSVSLEWQLEDRKVFLMQDKRQLVCCDI